MKKSIILILGIFILIILSNIVYAEPAKISIKENIDISYGFIAEKIEIHSKTPFQFIKFNITGLKEYISCSYLQINNSVITRGRINNNQLVFELETPQKTAEAVIIFSNVFFMKNNSLYTIIPMILSPIGLSSNITIIVFSPTKYFTVEENPVNASVKEIFIKANLTGVDPGEIRYMKLKFNPYAFSLFYISQLNRTILVENSNYVKIIDSFEITGLTYVKTKGIYLRYPKNIEILGVEGPLGPYVKDGVSSSYSIETKNDKKILNIKLRSPPQNYGDKTYFKVILGLKMNSSNELVVPIFGYDFLIKNYSIVVKIRGEADFNNIKVLKEEKEGTYTLYYLNITVPLYSKVSNYSIVFVPKIIPGGIPSYVYSSLGILFSIIAIGAIYFVVLKRERKQVVQVKKEIVKEEREDTYSKIYEYEKARVQILETMMDTWRNLENKKISRQTYKQRYSRLIKREKEYASKVNDIARGIDDSRLKKDLNIIDENILDFKRLYKMLEKTMANFSRGIISKREYRRRIDDIIRDLEDRIEKLYETVESLQE